MCTVLAAMSTWATTFTQGAEFTSNQRVSANGKYLVGYGNTLHEWGWDYINGYDSFITNLETNTTTQVSNYDSAETMGKFTDVNNEGAACGMVKDLNMQLTITDMGETYTLPLNVAAVWKDGKITTLGYGDFTANDFSSFMDGSVATAISNDNKTVVGYITMGNYAAMFPYAWILNESTNVYEAKRYAVPDNTLACSITDVSGDGTIAVGRIKFKNASYKSYPCYWLNSEECIVIEDELLAGMDQTFAGNAFAISDNGRYIGIVTEGNEPMLYSIDQKTILRRLGTHENVSGVEIGGVTDAGDIYGIFKYPSYGFNRPFWYSMNDLMTVDFDYFIYRYCSDAEIPYKFSYWAQENLSISSVSADGKIIAGNDDFGSPWILNVDTSYKTIPSPLESQVTANATGLGQITIQFDRNSFEGYMSYDAIEYLLYRDGKQIASFEVAELEASGKNTVIYEDNGVTPGTHYYSVAISYADSYDIDNIINSPMSKEVKCYLESNFDFPLVEDFESGMGANGWTIQRDYGETDFQNWGFNPYFGLDASSFASTACDQLEPYSYSLVSRHIDARDKDNVYISFARKWVYVNSYDWDLNYDKLSLEVSTNGVDWIVAKDLLISELEPDSWSFENIDLTPYAAGKTFQVRFHMHGEAKAMMQWMIDALRIDEKPQHEGVEAIGMAESENKFRLLWKNSIDAYQLSYLTNPTRWANGLCVGNEGNEMIAVNKFEPADLRLYDGKYITSITTEIEKFESEDTTPIRVAIVVYENGQLIREQEVDNDTYNTYVTFKLDEPVKINANNELMVGLKLLEHGADQIPLVYQNTKKFYNGKSNLFSTDGGTTWKSLADWFAEVPEHETDGDACWLISANVTDTAEATNFNYNTNQYAYEIYKNGEKYTTLLTHFLEPGFVDDNSQEGDVYEVRTFYLDTTVSELSNSVKNEGMSSVETIINGSAAYTVNGGVLTAGDENAVIELYNTNGIKLYEGKGSINLNRYGKGIVIMKVTPTNGEASTHKLVL